MSDESPNAVEQEADASYLTFMPGARLKKARVLRGLSAAQVARELNLSERYIASMEADEYAGLPEPAFIRGYLRSYAALVKLSADDIVARFDENYAAQRQSVDAQQAPRNPLQLLGDLSHQRSRSNRLAFYAGLGLLVIFLLGIFLWKLAAPKPSPVAAPIDAAAAALSAPLPVVPLPAASAPLVPVYTPASSGAGLAASADVLPNPSAPSAPTTLPH